MVMTLTNQRLLHRIYYSKIIGRSLGSKWNKENDLVISRTESSQVEAGVSHNRVKEFFRRNLETTDALDAIMGKDENGSSILNKIPSSVKILGQPTKFADLASYDQPKHDGNLKNHVWIEMHIASVNSLLQRVIDHGKADLLKTKVSYLKKKMIQNFIDIS